MLCIHSKCWHDRSYRTLNRYCFGGEARNYITRQHHRQHDWYHGHTIGVAIDMTRCYIKCIHLAPLYDFNTLMPFIHVSPILPPFYWSGGIGGVLCWIECYVISKTTFRRGCCFGGRLWIVVVLLSTKHCTILVTNVKYRATSHRNKSKPLGKCIFVFIKRALCLLFSIQEEMVLKIAILAEWLNAQPRSSRRLVEGDATVWGDEAERSSSLQPFICQKWIGSQPSQPKLI